MKLFMGIVIINITFLLNGCGQSGRLYLPEPPPIQGSTSHT